MALGGLFSDLIPVVSSVARAFRFRVWGLGFRAFRLQGL